MRRLINSLGRVLRCSMPSEYWSTMDCVGLRSGMSQLLRCYPASCMHLLCGGVWWTLVEGIDFNPCLTRLWSRDSSLRIRHLWNCFVIALTWSCSPPSYETLIMFCTSSYHLSNIPPITFGLGRTIEWYLMLDSLFRKTFINRMIFHDCY